MKSSKLFPLGKAYGEAFCNRVQQTHKLVNFIERGRHVFLVAPRRYGKSSLCEQALRQTSIPWSKIDLHIAVTEQDAERHLINGITDLLTYALGKGTEKLMMLAKRYAQKLQPKLGVGPEYLRLELTIADSSSPASNIQEAILILDKLLQEKNQQAVLMLDEFQEINTMQRGKGIEGAIRSAAQETQNLSIIFCGSNPHLLKAMFEDERRPLYKLCRKLTLDRISETDYYNHLNFAACSIWGQELPEPVLNKIMAFTERHPYYVNYLCDELSTECDCLPSEDDIERAWQLVIEEERSDLIKEFSTLSLNQRKVMIYIVNHGGQHLFSHQASQSMGIPASSISRTLEALLEKDLIEKIDNTYRVIVPVYKSLLAG